MIEGNTDPSNVELREWSSRGGVSDNSKTASTAPERGQFAASEKQGRVHDRFAQTRRILQNLEIVLAST